MEMMAGATMVEMMTMVGMTMVGMTMVGMINREPRTKN
jgi:hypothetical protein